MISDEKMTAVELEKILETYELNHLHTDIAEKIVILVIASLGLITALAWDTALSSIFKRFFGDEHSLAEEITYAITVTIIAATVSVILSRSLKRKAKKLNKSSRKSTR